MSEDDRSQAWRDALAQLFAGLTVEGRARDGSTPATGGARSVALASVGVHRVWGTTQELRRGPGVVRRRPSELLKLCLVVQGRVVVDQAGRQVGVGPGQLALYDTSIPYRLQLLGPWKHVVMTVPRTALGLPEHQVSEAMEHPWQADDGPGLMLSSFLRTAHDLTATTGPAAGHVASAAASLLTSVLVTALAPAGDVGTRAVREGMIEHLRRHLHDPDLDTAALAGAFHLSPRSVQRVFAEAGLSVHRVIRDERLDALARDLRDPALATRPVSVLAARYAVVDKSWLARAFRHRFGQSPTAYRREVLSSSASAARL